VNPPEVRLRDLNSANGTMVDGVLYRQSADLSAASEAATRIKPSQQEEDAEAVLRDGSRIEVGYTKITVTIESPPYCVECGEEIPGGGAVTEGEMPVCAKCRQRRPEPRDAKSDSIRRQIRDIVKAHGSPRRGLPDIPGHEIRSELAQGGMGMVLEATQLADGRRVAMKIIRPERRRSPELRGRFKREMRICQALDHPNIVSLLDFGETVGILWFTMEFIEGGQDVQKRLKAAGGRLPASECVGLILQCLEGLAYAHDRGIVHRDLKPPNILLTSSEGRTTAKLTDFGLAKSLEDTGLNGSIFTRSGVVAMGTLPFMPPEQARDVRTSTPSTDVFSMGATLYQMLTGRLIRDFSRNLNHAIRQVISEPPVPILNRGVPIPAQLAKTVDRALAMDPDSRFQHASEFQQALRESMSPPS